jgi:serine protease AprX
MKKLCLLIIVLLVSTPVLAGKLKPDLADIINKTPDQNISVIVLFYEKPGPANISIIKSDGASIKHQYKLINAVSAKIPARAADKMAKRAFVKLVEPDYKVKLVLDKSISQIQADKVWQDNITGKEIDVAVIDTGIHDEHPALTVEKEVDYTGEGTDDLNGHGTHVAGIVASTDLTYRGVAYDADLFNVKVLNKDGSGYASDVIKGIEWAVDNDAEVISMSLGAQIDPCDGTDALSQAVDSAVNKGVVAVVAAGNSGPDSGTITSPGCSKQAITVGAVDDTWSSRGPTDDGRVKPDIVAPGVSIKSTWKDNSFIDLSGTSMSTPHVSGVAALLLETSSLTPNDIKNILKTTAVDLGLDENTQGAGRVDAYAAYLYAQSTTTTSTSTTTSSSTTTILEEGNKTPPGLAKKNKTFTPPGLRKKPGITPDSWLYGFKKFFENVDMFLTFDEVERAEKYVQYAELRLVETKEMIEKGKPEFVDDLLNEYEVNLEKGNKISKHAHQTGKNIEKLTELIAVTTSVHIDVLEDVLQKVPEQAKPAIEKAIGFSKKGNEEALDVLEKVKPEKAAEIHFRIAEKKLIKAKEKADESKIEEVKDLIKDYEQQIDKSAKSAEIAKDLGKDTDDIDKLVANAGSKHIEILSEVHDKVPEQAKPAIEKAINASIKRKQVSEALKKSKQKHDSNTTSSSVETTTTTKTTSSVTTTTAVAGDKKSTSNVTKGKNSSKNNSGKGTGKS